MYNTHPHISTQDKKSVGLYLSKTAILASIGYIVRQHLAPAVRQTTQWHETVRELKCKLQSDH